MKKNRISSIGFFLGEGFRNIFLHGFMSFAAVSVIVICLIITGTTALVSYNINLNILKLQNESEIIIYIEDTYTDEQARDLHGTIMQVDNVQEAEFESRDVALENYRQKLGENADLLDGFDETNNPLRDAYHITMKDPAKVVATKAALESVDGVGSVVANEAVVAKLIQVQRMFQVIAVTLVIALGLISIFIIANTVKLAMLARRREISIQKMVGATNWFIRWPFVIEGLVLGLIACGIAFGLEWMLYNQLTEFIVGNLPQFAVAKFEDLMFYVLSVFGVAGIIVGVSGSSLTIRRFMDV
ncbi:MAG: permease-like cell division protein FtsX [Butyricicoccus pullicaecorum]|nr:permease-like cell division protein FtsX [Butyricicoccus pullicaecorum]MDO4669519.1 permease-like cell division protein FtsX [Butyricicoccus pullicaecorum]